MKVAPLHITLDARDLDLRWDVFRDRLFFFENKWPEKEGRDDDHNPFLCCIMCENLQTTSK